MSSEFDAMVAWFDAGWPVKDSIVQCAIGPSGIGKTAAVKEHAKRVGAGKVITIIASQILPNEVSGITMPVPERHAMEIFDHYRLSSLEDGDILFFDELLEADQMVLSACLTLIESRMLMSGAMLPDIQIIAATNMSIAPSMLKTNIKQRFMWREFDVDRVGCREYLKKRYGVDVGPEIVSRIVADGPGYNILTQRSLTKIVGWLAAAKDQDQRKEFARQIDWTWDSDIGTQVCNKFIVDPMAEIQKIILETLSKDGAYETADAVQAMIDDGDCTIDMLVEYLQAIPQWDEISKVLESTQVDEAEFGV